MSCPHLDSDVVTRTTTLNPSTEQTERVCGRCGTVLSVSVKEVRV